MSEGGVVTPRPAQYAEASALTRQVLSLLPDLRVVVLIGRHAEKAWPLVGSPLPTVTCPHPSPQNINPQRQAAAQALGILVEAYKIVLGTKNRTTPVPEE